MMRSEARHQRQAGNVDCLCSSTLGFFQSIKSGMGPYPNGPRSVSCDRAIRHSGLGVPWTVGPVGDFLDLSNLLESS